MPTDSAPETVATRASEPTGGCGWEHFPHAADVGIRGYGRTPAEAFEQAGYALSAVVTESVIEPKTAVEIRCHAPDLELLFVEWLNRIIYEMAVRQMLFGRYAVQLSGNTRLTASLWGEALDIPRHAPACEPKGATYTALSVQQHPGGRWTAACVIDV